MVKELTREILWESGSQFGHQTKKWNPKMKPYIYGEKNKIHIIDLQQTIWKLEDVKKIIINIVENKGKILFVGTKKQARWIIKDVAERCNCFYVNQRWLGGTLTNLKTIHLRVKKLINIEWQEKNNELKLLPKKEQILIKKEKNKLEKLLGGIKGMKELPQALFVVDPKEEYISVREAKKLNIPIIAICDTNVDPDLIDYIIPANDDTSRSISIITNYIANLYCDLIGIKIFEPQFKQNEFISRDIEKKHNLFIEKYNNNNKINIKNVHDKEEKKNDNSMISLTKKDNIIPIKKRLITNISQNFNLDSIIIINNNLEQTLYKLKFFELENIGKIFKLPKLKKNELIYELSKKFIIINNKIIKK